MYNSTNNTLNIGYSKQVNTWFNGDIAEIVTYGRILTSKEYEQVNSYLMLKYFLQASAIPLFIFSSVTINSGISLFTESVNIQLNNIPLYTSGAKNSSSGHIPLYVENNPGVSSGISLFIATRSSGVLGMPLFIHSKANPSVSGKTPLFLAGPLSSNHSGLYKSLPLFLNNGRTSSPGLPLFLYTGPTQTKNSGNMPLFLKVIDTTGTIANTIPMFLGNTAKLQNKSGKLFTQGLGSLDGGSIGQSNMPLFIGSYIARSNFISMYIGSKTNNSGLIPMTISGVLNNSSNVPLFIGGIQYSGGMPLYIGGPQSGLKGLTMTISGKPFAQQNKTLFVDGF
jgi:hypothetical protein